MRYVLVYIFIIASVYACNTASDNSNPVESKTEVINGISYSTFKVWGNCGMCKITIESSLKIDGIEEASWDPETKIMKVSYNGTKISLDSIQKKIADVGYDTPQYTALDLTYNNLHKCCKYDRKPESYK